MGTMEQRLHVHMRDEDGAYWATVDEYPGVFAAGDDLEELRASIEERICLITADAGDDLPDLRVSELQLESGQTRARAELVSL